MSTLLTVNIDQIKYEYKILNNQQSKEKDELIEKGIKVNWRQYANAKEKFFKNYFEEIRNDFINSFSKLEGGRINAYLSQNLDSISPSIYSDIESWFINGWRYDQEGEEFVKGDYSHKPSKTRVKYMKFLTEQLG